MRLIDADKLMLYLNDYALQESPSNVESADDRKNSGEVYKTITDCIRAVETQATAFDVEKVVEQLDVYITKLVGRNSALYQTVMQIVKGGGLRTRLPCKVGDMVWELCLCDDGNYKIFPMIVKTISEYGTLRQVKKDITIWNIYAESDYTYMYKNFADFGKSVFSTKEEAEKKLEEMHNE